MPINSTHPQYDEKLPLWTLCRDCHEGQHAIKAKQQVYLPATEGMHIDGMDQVTQQGYRRYAAYLRRAVFPEVVTDTVNILIGIMNRKEPTIQLPAQLEDMRHKATILGESLNDMLRKIHEQQLVTGRVGLHVDVPEQEVQAANIMPLLATYTTESVINWDDGQAGDPTRQTLNLVVLDESEWVREGLEWVDQEKYRVLVLGNFEDNEGAGVYRSGVFSAEQEFDPSGLNDVSLRGQTSDEVPFVFIGPHDIDINTDLPPLLGLAQRSLAIYLGEADLRNSLFLTGQDTLVTVGATLSEDIQMGPGARIPMQEGGDAKFIGVDSNGIPHQISNLVRDYEIANSLSARLVQRGSSVESGDALRIRVASQTASLTSIAKASAAGLQEALRMAARWIGANPDEVVVQPNLDFADDPMEAQQLLDLLTYKQRGGIISYRTLSEIKQRRDISSRNLEDEIEEIEAEEGIIPEDILEAATMAAAADTRGGFGQPFEDPEETGNPDDSASSGDGG